MNSAIIGTLLIAALFFAFRWFDSKAEIARLQGQVATLKRQLARRG